MFSPSITLHHGDCLPILKTLPSASVDMVFADPPFNIGKRYAGKKGDARADYYAWCAQWIAECFRVLKPTGAFYHMTLDRHLEKILPLMSAHGVFVSLVKWRNVSAARHLRQFWNSTQPIVVYGKTAAYKFNRYAQTRSEAQCVKPWNKARAQRAKRQMLDYWDDIRPVFAGSIQHPEAILVPGTRRKVHVCQMPLALAVRCIVFSTDEGDTVLDPFTGSGTTGVASLQLKRHFMGIEREEVYCQMARQRWEEQVFIHQET
ncbi:MAG: site-specific DNA-methyltransferase [Chloroflexi bacterium]|nr:site-specific DNA-methyltransferase [Chloroflexota bacterium]